MKRILWLGMAAGIVLSCTNNAEEKKADSDTTAATGEIITSELDSVSVMGEAFKAIDPSFDVNSFQQMGESTLASPSSPAEMQQVGPFLPYLLYNADSSLAIDPYSYNYLLQERDNQKRVVDAGPDAEIALFHPKTVIRRRIWFSGPGARVLEVKWKNENVVWIAGLVEVSAETHVPFIQEIDTRTNTVVHYEAGDTVKAVPQNILKESLERKLKTSHVF